MKFANHLIRLTRINFVLIKYGVFNRNLSRGERARCALQELGPIFVKAGQILSTRRDLLPDDIANELAKLQDQVPPFSGVEAKIIIEKALGYPVENVFSEFDLQALASASIAQVHAADLLNGESVVIKVLRPDIRKIIERDVDLLMSLAKLVERFSKQGKKFKPQILVNEIAQTLFDELDLMREGSNASQLRRNFTGSPYLHIPKIYWQYSRPDILVMERIRGIPINDTAALNNANVNMRALAERSIEIFFTQVFRDSFFHADLHPGNIFVNATNPDQPTLMMVDFGIVGSLSHEDQRYLAENMIAFFKRDYQRVAELHIACGWLPPDTRIDQFEGAIRAVSEPIFEQRLRDISFGFLLLRLFQVARRFNINIQPQLILLQKSLLNIEGLCRELAPDFDLWGSAAPQIESWLKKQVGPRSFFKRLRENLPLWSEQIPAIPSLIYEVLKETKQRQEKNRFVEMTESKNIHSVSLKLKTAYFLCGAAIAAAVMVLLHIK